jgi:hypothetical protein
VTWAPDYCTVAEVKSYLRIDDTDDDVLLGLWVTAASRAVDKHCGRQFGQVASTETREYRPDRSDHHHDHYRQWWPYWTHYLGAHVYQIDDLMDVDDLTVIDADANVITDYELGPVNAPQKGRPYERLITHHRGPLTLDGLWGWPAVPAAVKVATMLQAARLAARRDSPFGIAGSPSDGSELRLLATLDPDLKTSLSGFRRDWWAA